MCGIDMRGNSWSVVLTLDPSEAINSMDSGTSLLDLQPASADLGKSRSLSMPRKIMTALPRRAIVRPEWLSTCKGHLRGLPTLNRQYTEAAIIITRGVGAYVTGVRNTDHENDTRGCEDTRLGL